MNIAWGIRRLRAMTLPELAFRFSQKRLQECERKLFAVERPIWSLDTYGRCEKAVLDRLGVQLGTHQYQDVREIDLLGGYDYDEYRSRWHAAFQSEGDWPLHFSWDYSFGGKGVPGDIRTNWELNRHYQFVVLAKVYATGGSVESLQELLNLFYEWGERNPFLRGPEWSSPMEVSIRLVNWLITARLLSFREVGPDLAQQVLGLQKHLIVGSWNMASFVRNHYSRYSSANNHTIVEAVGVGVAAIVFGKYDWLDEVEAIISDELHHQVYQDGVNKEQSLHYQLFVMEALCLLVHVLRRSGHAVPDDWNSCILRMSNYVKACAVGRGGYIAFGDDDEGALLNCSGSKPNYSEYVLSFVSLELAVGKKWLPRVCRCENLYLLFSEEDFEKTENYRYESPKQVEHFPDGGITIMRSSDNRIVLAFDHGPLGFGSLAAHGHADALSVQLYYDGFPVFVDPGTYIYNGDSESRTLYRGTKMHNTLCIDEKDQSEQLGAFLWGRKANTKLLNFVVTRNGCDITAEHDGYAPVIHRRSVSLMDSDIIIRDSLNMEAHASVVFLVPAFLQPVIDGNCVRLHLYSCDLVLNSDVGVWSMDAVQLSPSYGKTKPGYRISCKLCGQKTLNTCITCEMGE